MLTQDTPGHTEKELSFLVVVQSQRSSLYSLLSPETIEPLYILHKEMPGGEESGVLCNSSLNG